MKTMAARCARFIEREIEKFVEDEDAKNKKESAKVGRQVFQEYLKEKKITEREEKTLLGRDFKTFWGTVSFIAVYYYIWDFQCII